MKNTSYQAESMQFLRTLLDAPGQYEQQQQLRDTWWDRGFIDLNEQQDYHASNIPQSPYVYFSYKK